MRIGEPSLLQPIFHLSSCEGPAERALLFFELRFEVGAQFGDDVVLPLPGQVLAYGFEITVEKFHGVFLCSVHWALPVWSPRVAVTDALMACHSASNCANICSPSVVSR